MLKIFLSWKYRTFINQLDRRFNLGKTALIVVVFLLVILLLAMASSLGFAVRLQNIELNKTWRVLLGLTTIFALFEPIRKLRTGKTGLGKFNFFPITKIEAYLKDWLDRLLTIQSVVIFFCLIVFGAIVISPVYWILLALLILFWVMVLQSLTRTIYALFNWLISVNKYFQHLLTLLVILLYFGATQSEKTPQLEWFFKLLSDYWVSSIYAKSLITFHGIYLLWSVVIFVFALWVDYRLFIYLDAREDQSNKQINKKSLLGKEKNKSPSQLKNMFIPIFIRHPVLAMATMMYLVMIIVFMIPKISKPLLVTDSIDKFYMSSFRYFIIMIAVYGFGMIMSFADVHLNDPLKIRKVLGQLKIVLFFLCVIFSAIELLTPILFFPNHPDIFHLVWHWLASFGIMAIGLDLILINTAFAVIPLPPTISFNSGYKISQTSAILTSMFFMILIIVLSLIGSWLIESSPVGVVSVISTSGLLTIVSFLFIPKLTSKIIYSRREYISEQLKVL